jgi:hypothetical protein
MYLSSGCMPLCSGHTPGAVVSLRLGLPAAGQPHMSGLATIRPEFENRPLIRLSDEVK